MLRAGGLDSRLRIGPDRQNLGRCPKLTSGIYRVSRNRMHGGCLVLHLKIAEESEHRSGWPRWPGFWPITMARPIRSTKPCSRYRRFALAVKLTSVTSAASAINPLAILYHRATVRGIAVGSRESFEAMNRAIEANNIRPVIDKAFPWTDAVAAIRYMQEGRRFGKIILKF
jgi:hypothetical protein